MAPAQSLPIAGDGGEEKPKVTVKSEAEEVDADPKEEASGLICENNREDSGFVPEKEVGGDPFGQEIDVLGCADGEAAVFEPGDDGDPDATETEHSSSFGNTFSGSDDEVKLSSSDMEVDSQFSAENAEPPAADGCGRLFKKKKVTSCWRRFISPLMWRCQWLELRMHELHSQASIYDKELAGYKREKQLQSKMIELDDSVSRSVPLTCQSHKKRAMRRKKRKRNEDTVDISSYMASHNIFSYYENRKSETDGHSIDDDCGNQVDENMKGTDDHEWLVRGFKGGDNSLEQIFFNIEALQSRVLKLKSQLSKVISRNSRDISSTAGNFFHGDTPNSYAQSHSCSPGNNGDILPRQHASEYELEDITVPGSAVSSFGDAADLDIIESTTGILSAANIPQNQHQVGVSCMDIADGILINNQAADEELQNFEVSHVTEKPQVVKEEAQSCSEDESTDPKVLVEDPDPEREIDIVQPPVLKTYTGKKRGRKPKKKRGGSVAGYRSERLQKRRLN